MPKYLRKVIRIRATDSPNVRLYLAEVAAGRNPTFDELVPGVLSAKEYLRRRRLWDPVRQCIGLDGEFWQGADLLLYPPDWLNHAAELHRKIFGTMRKAEGIGIDPAEGGDKTSMCAVDKYGLIELVAKKTKNTAVITGEALAFMQRHGVPPERVCFDRGGGGQQHADRLRQMGHNVRTVGFGESVMLEPKRGLLLVEERMENREDRYVFLNRRAEMYGTLSQLLDPSTGPGYAIPEKYTELRRQMAPIPLTFDEHGRLRIIPKDDPGGSGKKLTLKKLLGCSPDELDSFVLAVHAMLRTVRNQTAGAL